MEGDCQGLDSRYCPPPSAELSFLMKEMEGKESLAQKWMGLNLKSGTKGLLPLRF